MNYLNKTLWRISKRLTVFLSLIVLVTSCSATTSTKEESPAVVSKKDIAFIDSSLTFQCGEKNDFFYNLYFEIGITNM